MRGIGSKLRETASGQRQTGSCDVLRGAIAVRRPQLGSSAGGESSAAPGGMDAQAELGQVRAGDAVATGAGTAAGRTDEVDVGRALVGTSRIEEPDMGPALLMVGAGEVHTGRTLATASRAQGAEEGRAVVRIGPEEEGRAGVWATETPGFREFGRNSMEDAAGCCTATAPGCRSRNLDIESATAFSLTFVILLRISAKVSVQSDGLPNASVCHDWVVNPGGIVLLESNA